MTIQEGKLDDDVPPATSQQIQLTSSNVSRRAAGDNKCDPDDKHQHDDLFERCSRKNS